jgi:hypothetical protein
MISAHETAWARPHRIVEPHSIRGQCEDLRAWLPGRQAERFGMDPAVVLGQHLAGLAGPVREPCSGNLST